MKAPRLLTPAAAIASVASVALCLLGGCPAEAPPHAPASPAPAAKTEAAPPAPPPAYAIDDPATTPTTIAIDGGFGVLVEGARVVVRGGQLRVARDVAAIGLASVERVPAWLGGGFLFRGSGSLWTSDAFDGPLRPILTFPSAIARVSFGPKHALVRTADGQRYPLDLRAGALAPVAPPGIVDVAALADGRALALAEGARLLVTIDHGDHWSDVTATLGGAPQALVAQDGEVFTGDDAGHVYRFEPGGALREIDSIPPAAPARIRPREPGWHGGEAPLTAAVRRGARLDDGTVIVADAGDVARVDLRTGAVKITAAGKLPPELSCEAMRAGDDVIAVCAASRRPSAVFSRLAGDESPRLERTFPVDGPFYASDDGALAFAGSCDGERLKHEACVRDLRGEWHDHTLDAAEPDGGAVARLVAAAVAGADAGPPEPSAADLARWVPRPDGRVMAIVAGNVPGTIDPDGGAAHAWKKGEADAPFEGELLRALQPLRGPILDRRWSMDDGGTLRGWLESGQAVKIAPSGEIQRSPFTYARGVESGAYGFAFDLKGRAYQSLDRGETWAEVVAPEVSRGHTAVAVDHCSAVGCALGPWLRLGWEPAPPPAVPEAAPPPPVQPPPHPPRAPLRELVCAAAGDERFAALPTTPASPEDLGFGARRVPLGGEDARHETMAYHRRFFSRGLVNPPYSASTTDADRAIRALVHGYVAEFQAAGDVHSPFDGIVVLGPSRDPQSFRREITFVEAFDPDAAVRGASFGLRDLLAPARSTGTPLGQLFASDGLDLDGLAVVLPADPAGASGLVFSIPSEAGQFYGVIQAGAAPKLRIVGLEPFSGSPMSAVDLGGGEVAVLIGSSDGSAEIVALRAAGLATVGHLAAPPDSLFAPANPDALALGPQGALAVLRTPSGAEPPSARDPALLLPLAGGPPIVLAPWSTLLPADAPACRADVGGYRAVVETVGPWLRLRGGHPAHEGALGATRARVRWSETRVCLEALELPDASKSLRSGDEVETAIVARFTGKPAAARIGFAPGVELRQPLGCTLAP